MRDSDPPHLALETCVCMGGQVRPPRLIPRLILRLPPSLLLPLSPSIRPQQPSQQSEACCQGISHMLEWEGLPERWGALRGL